MSLIEIDCQSGCCFGVAKALSRAEDELRKGETLYCLGDIVHNSIEVERLTKMGLITINHEQFAELKNAKVLLRAHGEPPSTYETAKKNNIELIDASCPVVLSLQRKIKKKYEYAPQSKAQIVIYGKIGHAEVNGLIGQTNDSAIIIENKDDLSKLNFKKDIHLFSQTTKSLNGLKEIAKLIESKMQNNAKFELFDTICRQVSNRVPNIKEFAQKHDLIFFIAGEKSSNGRELFKECKNVNPNSYLIHDPNKIDYNLLTNSPSVGICGATSTPMWQMEVVANNVKKIISPNKIEKVAF